MLVTAEQTGEWVAVGSVDYIDPNDVSVAARYRDALDSLCQRDLVKHEDGVLYRITAEGFKVAGTLLPGVKIESAPQPAPRSVDHVPFDNLAGVAARDGEFNELSTLFLVAFPIDAVEILDINAGRAAPIIQLLTNPPSLRANGFDVIVESEMRVVRSGLRRACRPGQALLELHRNGTLIFLSNVWNAPCWSSQQDSDDPLRINPLGLAETIYNFIELARRISEELRPPSHGFGFDLGFWRLEHDGHRASLGPGSLLDRAYQRRRGFLLAPDTNYLIRFDWLSPVINVVSFRQGCADPGQSGQEGRAGPAVGRG